MPETNAASPICTPPLTALVPLKAADNKRRLREVLGPAARTRLSRWMAVRTLRALRAAAGVGEVRLVGGAADRAAQALAAEAGAAYVRECAPELNAALQDELDRCLAAGRGALIVFADLPLLTRAAVEALLEAAGRSGADLTLAPDAARRGTNALLCRGPAPLQLAYGADSFPRFLASAGGRSVHVFAHPAFAQDLDTPADWARLRRQLGALAEVDLARADG